MARATTVLWVLYYITFQIQFVIQLDLEIRGSSDGKDFHEIETLDGHELDIMIKQQKTPLGEGQLAPHLC